MDYRWTTISTLNQSNIFTLLRKQLPFIDMLQTMEYDTRSMSQSALNSFCEWVETVSKVHWKEKFTIISRKKIINIPWFNRCLFKKSNLKLIGSSPKRKLNKDVLHKLKKVWKTTFVSLFYCLFFPLLLSSNVQIIFCWLDIGVSKPLMISIWIFETAVKWCIDYE